MFLNFLTFAENAEFCRSFLTCENVRFGILDGTHFGKKI